MRSNIEKVRADGILVNQDFRLGVTRKTLSGTTAIERNATPVQVLDPGGSNRNVTLPAVGAGDAGLTFLIVNAADAAEVITVQDSAGQALVPPITPTQNESALVVWTGTAWRGVVAIGA